MNAEASKTPEETAKGSKKKPVVADEPEFSSHHVFHNPKYLAAMLKSEAEFS